MSDSIAVHEIDKPLTMNLQDRHNRHLKEAMSNMIALNVIDTNLKNSDQKTHAVMNEIIVV